MYNKFPYTDFHELNLDWFLEQFKELMENWGAQKVDYEQFKLDVTTEFNTLSGKFDDLDEAFRDLKSFIENYFENLDVQTEINNKLDEMASDGTLSALIQPLFDEYKTDIDAEVETQDGRISVLEGRMDTFATLAEGSTTGDAELMDIRVGNDGYIYPDAGDAVRGQADILQYQVDSINKNKSLLIYGHAWESGNIDSSGNFSANTQRIRTKTYVPKINKSIRIEIDAGFEYVRRFFNNDDTYASGDNAFTSSDMRFVPEYDKMYLVVRKSDNSAIDPGDIEGHIHVYVLLSIDTDNLAGYTWLTLGDSITARGWYQDMVQDICDISYVNYGIGGTSIAKKWSSTPDAFCVRYVDMQNDADMVMVWGGVNDFSLNIPMGTKGSTNTMTFYGALKVLIEGLIAKYPDTKIGFVLTPQVNNTDATLQYKFDVQNTEGLTLMDYNNAIKEMCEEYALPVLDLYHNCGMNQLNMQTMTSNVTETSPDGLHPSRLAMTFFKYMMFDFLKTKLR